MSKIITFSAPFGKSSQFYVGPQILHRVADSVHNSAHVEPQHP